MATGSSDDEEYDDFATEKPFASFKLVVGQQTLFVNAHALAESSPVFAKMLFSDGFKEKGEGQATIGGGEAHSNILEMLRCMLPSGKKTGGLKAICGGNVTVLVRLADQFEIERLTAACEHFIQTELVKMAFTDTKMVRMLNAAVLHRLSKESLSVIVKLLAAVSDVSALNQMVSFDPTTLPKKVTMAVMLAFSQFGEKVGGHALISDGGRSMCEQSGCGAFLDTTRYCLKCKKCLCPMHQSAPYCVVQRIRGDLSVGIPRSEMDAIMNVLM